MNSSIRDLLYGTLLIIGVIVGALLLEAYLVRLDENECEVEGPFECEIFNSSLEIGAMSLESSVLIIKKFENISSSQELNISINPESILVSGCRDIFIDPEHRNFNPDEEKIIFDCSNLESEFIPVELKIYYFIDGIQNTATFTFNVVNRVISYNNSSGGSVNGNTSNNNSQSSGNGSTSSGGGGGGGSSGSGGSGSGGATPDTTSPLWSNNLTNSTIAGTNVLHSVRWTDNTALSGYIFSFDNGTGTFVNDSFVGMTGTTNYSNVIKYTNGNLGSLIRWRVYSNDSSSNWNVTNQFSYLTTNPPDTTPPTWSSNLTNSNLSQTNVLHSVLWTDNTALSGYIFSFDNGTGTFVNDSFVIMTGTTNYSNVTKFVNSTVGSTIRWRVYSNDSSGNLNSTNNFSYETTEVLDLSCDSILEENTVYTLTENLSSTGNCFNISSQNVTLDCAGFSLIGDNATNSYGVYSDKFNTTIKNCQIQNYSTQIYFSGASNSTVFNVSMNSGNGVKTSSSEGSVFENLRINATGRGVLIEGNQHLFRNSNVTSYNDFGVYVQGEGNNLSRLNVSSNSHPSLVFEGGSSNNVSESIFYSQNNSALYIHETILNRIYKNSFSGRSYGLSGVVILTGSANDNLLFDNSINAFGTLMGLSMGGETNTGNLIRNNTFLNSTTHVNFTDKFSSGNTFCLNNFTNASQYVYDLSPSIGGGGYNFYNCTYDSKNQGNIWDEVISGLVEVYGLNSSSISGLYLGEDGSGFPFSYSASLKFYCPFADCVDYVPLTKNISDLIPPTYLNPGYNSTSSGQITKFSILWNDGVALHSNGYWIFSTNNSGTWVNDSAINFTSTPSWSNVTKIINDTVGMSIGYRWYTRDNKGNMNATPVYSFGTTISCGSTLLSNVSYALTQNLSSFGSTCFTVTSQNVTLDCNGFSIIGNNSPLAYGILSNVTNTTIKNCYIEGYRSAIRLSNSSNSTIKNVTGKTVLNNEAAAYIYLSNGLNLTNSTFESSLGSSVFVYYSSFSNFENVTSVSNLSTGSAFYIYESHNNTFKNVSAESPLSKSIVLFNVNNTNISNSCLESNVGNEIEIFGGYNNYFYNNNFTSNNQIHIRIFSGENNIFWWNNFSNTSGMYVQDTLGNNHFNYSINGVQEGNIWYNVINGSVNITGNNYSSGFSTLYIGNNGTGYPYNSTTSGEKVTSNVVDYAPLTNTPTESVDCGVLNLPNRVYTLTQDVYSNGTNCFDVFSKNITLNCDGFSIIGNNTQSTNGISSNSTNTTIKNCNIDGYYHSILFDRASNSTVQNVSGENRFYADLSNGLNLTNSYFGVVPDSVFYIQRSHNLYIENVTLVSNSTSWTAFYLITSNNSIIKNISINASYSAINLESSNNTNLSNSNFRSIKAPEAVLFLSYNNSFYNNTFAFGNQSHVKIVSGSNNTLWWNNFTNISGMYVNDSSGNNHFNRSVNGQQEGNVWDNVISGEIEIKGTSSSLGYPSWYVGNNGAGYPYNSTTSGGKVSSNVYDYHPITNYFDEGVALGSVLIVSDYGDLLTLSGDLNRNGELNPVILYESGRSEEIVDFIQSISEPVGVTLINFTLSDYTSLETILVNEAIDYSIVNSLSEFIGENYSYIVYSSDELLKPFAASFAGQSNGFYFENIEDAWKYHTSILSGDVFYFGNDSSTLSNLTSLANTYGGEITQIQSINDSEVLIAQNTTDDKVVTVIYRNENSQSAKLGAAYSIMRGSALISVNGTSEDTFSFDESFDEELNRVKPYVGNKEFLYMIIFSNWTEIPYNFPMPVYIGTSNGQVYPYNFSSDSVYSDRNSYWSSIDTDDSDLALVPDISTGRMTAYNYSTHSILMNLGILHNYEFLNISKKSLFFSDMGPAYHFEELNESMVSIYGEENFDYFFDYSNVQHTNNTDIGFFLNHSKDRELIYLYGHGSPTILEVSTPSISFNYLLENRPINPASWFILACSIGRYYPLNPPITLFDALTRSLAINIFAGVDDVGTGSSWIMFYASHQNKCYRTGDVVRKGQLDASENFPDLDYFTPVENSPNDINSLTQLQLVGDPMTRYGSCLHDNYFPEVEIVSPLNMGVAQGLVRVQVNASDNVGLTGVSLYVNGVQLGTEDVKAPYEFDWWINNELPNGIYNLSASARDLYENIQVSEIVSVNVNSYIPCGTINESGTYTLNVSEYNPSTSSLVCLNVTSPNVVIDCNGLAITGSNLRSTYGIYSNQDNTTVKNCEISGFETGIMFDNVENGNITNVIVDSSNAYPSFEISENKAVFFNSALFSSIDSSNLSSKGYALFVGGNSTNNSFRNVNLSGEGYGMGLINSTNNLVEGIFSNSNFSFFIINSSNNTFNNTYAISSETTTTIEGGGDNNFFNFTSYTSSGDEDNAIVVLVSSGNSFINSRISNINENTPDIDSNYLFLIVYSNNSNISNNVLSSASGNHDLLVLVHSDYSIVKNNIFSNGKKVSQILASQDNTFFNNTLFSSEIGFSIEGGSSSNLFYWNNFTDILGIYIKLTSAGSNDYNTTILGNPEGNIYENLINGTVNITSDPEIVSSYGALFNIGNNGSGYPYTNATSFGKVSTGVFDYGPIILAP